jgi:hypothetical protein
MSPSSLFSAARRWFWRTLWALILLSCLAGSTVYLEETHQLARRFTRSVEFDFVGWTVQTLGIKYSQFSLGTTGYLDEDDQSVLVLEYMDHLGQAQFLEGRLAEIYGDPSLADPISESEDISALLAEERTRLAELQPVVEAILAEQASVVISELGLNVGGSVFPPVAFHFSPIPSAMIVSPRDAIRQDANVQLNPELTLEQKIDLESNVEQALDVSTLVVPIGGYGTFPTMIMETTALTWLTDTIVHEWTHNFLTIRPLGWNYGATPEMRTMNETTASIVGREIGLMILERYYPDRVPPPPQPADPDAPEPPPPAFDFRAEMHETRVHVDELLAEGRIEEAEAYMEARRQVFWNEGYRIRRLNQAYFAFYGAYADEPGGAAGEDPVGEAVRELWARIQSPKEFLLQMGELHNYAELEERLGRMPASP